MHPTFPDGASVGPVATKGNRGGLTGRYPARTVRAVEPDPVLQGAIDAVPGWAGRPVEVTAITTGITNRNFKVELDGEAFVLRLSGKDTELLGIDRDAEVEAVRAAAAAGVGPEVFAYLPGHSCLVTRWVQGEHIAVEDLCGEDALSPTVASLRTFHGCPPIPSSFPVFRIVEDYRRLAVERGVAIPETYEDVRAVAGRIEQAFGHTPMPLTTCHNDLLNANFLRDGDHVWIVDYEYSGMGDPFFDLGNLSINNDLTPEAQELLLSLYLGSVRDGHRARLALMRIVSDLREAMWGVVQQALSTLDFDYVDYAGRHFRRLLESADDPRFDDWLDAATVPP
jgi:thiamine kinase-like enzyme